MMLEGQHCLLGGVHAADAGAISFIPEIARADTLDKAIFSGILPSEGRLSSPIVGPEAAVNLSNSMAVITFFIFL